MHRFRARLGNKKHEPTPLTGATKSFIKGAGDEGLQALPFILESCSSAAESSLAGQVEVLELITKYYGQVNHLSRQLRCIDLLRYLSDQRDNELSQLLLPGHPLIKTIEDNLKTTRTHSALQRGTRVLLDHLVRQPNVPTAILELHAKHVHGQGKSPHPTIILSDQEVVADDIEAANAESELLATLLTEGDPENSLIKEVHARINNTRERLVQDVETSTSEVQTINIINAIENVERVLALYKDMQPKSLPRRTSATPSESSISYTAPVRRSSLEHATATLAPSSSAETQESNHPNVARYHEHSARLPNNPLGVGGSGQDLYEQYPEVVGSEIQQTQAMPQEAVPSEHKMRSNNPFATRSDSRSASSNNPFTLSTSPQSQRSNPFL